MWHEVRQAARTLGKHPGFVALSACVLALGIGLNTAIFSIVRSMLFTPLAVPASQELVSIYQAFPHQPDRPTILSSRQYSYLLEHNELFTGITAHWGTAFSVRAGDGTELVNGAWVLSNYFDVLGVKPLFGRALLPAEDDVANPGLAVVISHALWTRRFAGNPAVLGKTLDVSRFGEAYVPFTIVGVMPPEFQGVSEPWKPVQVWIAYAQRGDESSHLWSGVAIGRLRPGIPVTQARAVIREQGRQHYASLPNPVAAYEPRWITYSTDDVRTPFDPAGALIPKRLAAAMTLVVGLVLLVAAANIAGILTARAVGRAGEIAVRRALGASAARIARQLLIESLFLAAAGGVLGLLLAKSLVHLFVVLTPVRFAFDVHIDAVVLLFAAGVCLLAGVVVGVLPARQAGRVEVLPWLSRASGFQTGSSRARVRYGVTIPQAVVSLMLLLTAGVYVRSLLATELADLGYQPRNLLVSGISLRMTPDQRVGRNTPPEERKGLEARYAERTRRLYDRLLERLQAIPGVTDVAIASSLPLREPAERPDWSVVTEDALLAGQREGAAAERSMVSPGYFAVMGMRLVGGRDFDARDGRNTPKVAVVSVGLARSLWPGREAVGRTLALVNTYASASEKPELYTVVGIAGEVSPILHDRPSRPFVYLPLSQQWRPYSGMAIVRGAGDSRALIPSVKDAVARADAFADVFRAQTMSEMLGEIMYPRRIAGGVLAISGLVALFLATLGVYGVVSYAVAQRTGEIGVRMALGADRRDIRRLVLRDGLVIAAWAAVVGVALGGVAIRLTSSRYLPLPQLDIATVLAIPLLFTAVILLACYLPARRAGSVDPLKVLRNL